MKDIFEDMQAKIGCPYISDLPYHKRMVWHEMKRLPLADYDTKQLEEFISHYGSLEEVVEHYDEVFYYPDCENMTDIAYYYIDELQALGDIPSNLQNYIDYEAFGRDLSFEGTFIDTGRGMCEIPY